MLKWMNERVKRATAVDIALIKMSVFFSTIIIVKLFPQLTNIGYPALVILVILCVIKPVYNIWIKK